MFKELEKLLRFLESNKEIRVGDKVLFSNIFTLVDMTVGVGMGWDEYIGKTFRVKLVQKGGFTGNTKVITLDNGLLIWYWNVEKI